MSETSCDQDEREKTGGTTQSSDVLAYDGKSETWRAAYRSQEPFGQRLNRRRDAVVAAVEERLQGRRVRILDAGCGTGEVARRLMTAGHEVVALDASRDMLQVARWSHPSDRPSSVPAGFVLGSVTTLPIQSRSFDVVVCVGVVEHLMRRRFQGEVFDTAALTLRELARVLQLGGFMVMTAPNLLRIHWLLDPVQMRRALWHRRYVRRLEERHGGPNERRLAQREGTRRWTPWGWRRMLTREGLQIVANRGVGFGPFSVFGRRLMSSKRAVRLSERLERSVAAVKPFNWLSAQLITTIVLSQ